MQLGMKLKHSIRLGIGQASSITSRSCAPPRSVGAAPLRVAGEQQGRKRRKLVVVAAEITARETIEEAKEKFKAGDRMGALRAFERACRQDLPIAERREALYGATVVHASFGDIELAQMTLRDSLNAGLDFEEALKNDDASLLQWKSSPQVLSQLRKFARSYGQVRDAVQPRAEPRVRRAVGGGDASAVRPDPNMSLSEMLRTDISGMDATVTGIVKRVALLLLVGLLLGTVLFFGGLKLTGIAR